MMHDLKSKKQTKVKPNRKKRQRVARDWRKILHRTLRLGIGVGTLVLIGSGTVLTGRLLFHSDIFRISAMQVENEERVQAEDILALSDIEIGTNIFDLDLESIGRKIEEDPWIATAEIRRVFPRGIVIRVIERVPEAVINLGYLYYVDAAGEVFKVLEDEDSLDFPVITGIERDDLLDRPEEARHLLREAVELLAEIRQRERFTLDQVSELHADPVTGFRIHTVTGGVPIRLGVDQFEKKLDRLERIYPELEHRLRALKYIDLNVADRVIVKLDSRFTRGKG